MVYTENVLGYAVSPEMKLRIPQTFTNFPLIAALWLHNINTIFSDQEHGRLGRAAPLY